VPSEGEVLKLSVSRRTRNPVNFEFNDKVKNLQRRLQSFLDEFVYPNEQRFHEEIERDRWKPTRIIEELEPVFAE
jgi:acyl-CoA dehydrogenase